MDPNPYEAPQEEGYEQPAIPDGEAFSTQRLFAFSLCLMMAALATGMVVQLLSR